MEIAGIQIASITSHLLFFEKFFALRKVNSIFEYGSGMGSTRYFLNGNKCKKLYSLEMQSLEWFEKVKQSLQLYKNWEYFVKIGPQGSDFIKLCAQEFDLCFVDGHGDSRPECINAAFSRDIKYIVTHDTEQPTYNWHRIDMPRNYERFDFKEHNTWTTIFTTDYELIRELQNA